MDIFLHHFLPAYKHPTADPRVCDANVHPFILTNWWKYSYDKEKVDVL